MSEISPTEARVIAATAVIDRWGASMRELQRRALGLGPEQAPWDETNETEEAP